MSDWTWEIGRILWSDKNQVEVGSCLSDCIESFRLDLLKSIHFVTIQHKILIVSLFCNKELIRISLLRF